MKKAFVAAVVLAAWATGPAVADDIDDLVQQAIRGANSNTEKARKLLDASQLAKEDAKMETALLGKAVEYGIKDISQPAAREIVEKALDLLSARSALTPEQAAMRAQVYRQVFNAERTYEGKDRAARKLVPALLETARIAEAARKYQLARDSYVEAETVATKYNLPDKAAASYRARRAEAMAAAEKRAKQLQTTLAAKPDDGKSRMALLKLMVLEMDAPEEAAKFLSDDVEEVWKANVRLAAGAPDSLDEQAARELGEWYYGHMQTAGAPAHVKGTAAVRSQTYFRRFLSLHKKQDPQVLRAKLVLKEVDAVVAAAGGVASVDDGSVDLMSAIDTSRNVIAGQWARQELGLACGPRGGDTTAMLEIPPPTQVPRSYELTVTFARMLGNSTVAIVFPLSQQHVAMVLDNYGRYSGLEYLDTTYNSSTYSGVSGYRVHRTLENKRAYTATITVTSLKGGRVRITAALNDQEMSKWEGRESELSSYSSTRWETRTSGAFGLGAYRSQVLFNKIRLKPLK